MDGVCLLKPCAQADVPADFFVVVAVGNVEGERRNRAEPAYTQAGTVF